MSRSRHRVPASSFCNSGTMKQWKRGANKKLRSKTKQLLKDCSDWETLVIPHRYEVDNIYNSAKDGKYWVHWNKPDNDECIRDWVKHEGKYWNRWRGKWVFSSLDENGHYDQTGRTYRDNCQCICNKNSFYWKCYRK